MEWSVDWSSVESRFAAHITVWTLGQHRHLCVMAAGATSTSTYSAKSRGKATTCFNCQPFFAQHFPRAPLLSDRQNVELLFCRQKAGCRCMINCPCGPANRKLKTEKCNLHPASRKLHLIAFAAFAIFGRRAARQQVAEILLISQDPRVPQCRLPPTEVHLATPTLTD